MKVFIINLKEAKERRQSAASQLSRLNIDFEFFEAVNKNHSPEAHFDSINYFSYLIECSFLPSKGEIACYASHLSLWKKCVAIGQPVAILEDDFLASNNLKEALEFSEPYGNELGFIRLEPMSYKYPNRNNFADPAHKENGAFSLHRVENKLPFHTTGYIISPKAAQNLINKSKTISVPVDHLIRRNWAYGNAYYVLNPSVISLSDYADDSSIPGRTKLPISLLVKPLRALTRYYLRIAANRHKLQA